MNALAALSHWVDQTLSIAAGWMDQTLVLPVLFRTGQMRWEEISFDWCLVCLYGLVQVVLTFAVCWPLEAVRPLERGQDRRAVAVDAFYTLVSRVGIVPIVSFLLFYQAQVVFTGALVDAGYTPPMLETIVPAFFGHPVFTFAAYALILDFADYWRHRISHRLRPLYALHAVHHAQRHMSFWSDDRNHLLDDVVGQVWFFAVALLIGVPPLQFPLLVLGLRFVESLSHANVRLSFGRIGERLLISPRFHRMHHGVLAAGQRSCNYGAVFPFWDMLFRTADFTAAYPRTGDDDAPEAMASGGYAAQQAAGFALLAGSFSRGTRQAPHRAPPRA